MKSIRNKFPTVLRIGLGAMLLVFGLNGFLSFLPMPAPEGAAGAFMGGLAASGYFFPLLKATEILVGLALLFGRYVPLALTVLAPISINILGFHAALDPQGLPIALFVVVANGYLAWTYRSAFATVLAADAQPAEVAKEREPVRALG